MKPLVECFCHSLPDQHIHNQGRIQTISKVSLLFGPTQNFFGRPIMVDAEVEFLGPGSRGSVSGDALWNPRGKGGYPRGISGAKADVKEVPWMHQRRHLIGPLVHCTAIQVSQRVQGGLGSVHGVQGVKLDFQGIPWGQRGRSGQVAKLLLKYVSNFKVVRNLPRRRSSFCSGIDQKRIKRDQEGLKMGQEGLDSGYRVLSKKKAILCSEIGLGACGNAWSLPVMLVWCNKFCSQVKRVAGFSDDL